MKPFSKTVVSIINYRTADLTIQCVQSVLDELVGFDVHVVVIDNFSGDGSAEVIEDWIAGRGPEIPVTLVRSVTNSGFSGGHNQGMAARDAEFYLVLNSDALIRPGFFAALLDAARAYPEAGFFAPGLEFDDGQPQISCFRFFSPGSELIRAAATGPVTRLLARWDIPLGTSPDPCRIGWASFACILLRARMVREIGPMDEGYFLYFEDAEYCWRARRAGWRIVHVPDAHAVHFRGGSGPVKTLAAEKKRMPAYYYASRTRFLYQAYGWTGLLLANLLWHFGRLLANLRILTGRPVPRANKGELLDIWTNFMTPLGDRRERG